MKKYLNATGLEPTSFECLNTSTSTSMLYDTLSALTIMCRVTKKEKKDWIKAERSYVQYNEGVQ